MPLARARGKHLLPFLCRSTKKGRKKGNQGVPPWIPPFRAALQSRLGRTYFGLRRNEASFIRPLNTGVAQKRKHKTPRHSVFKCVARHIATTRGRRRRQNRFCLKFCLHRVRHRQPKICLCLLRASSVSVAFFKPRSQVLKMYNFAPQSEKSVIFRGALQGSKGH